MLAIIKYNAGNIYSVQSALQRIGVESTLTDDVEIIKHADKVLFPGVGEASSTMAYLRAKNLDQVIKSLTQPVLGICIGLQLMCQSSEEGDTECMGIFDNKVKRFVNIDNNVDIKIPHMGWNTILKCGDSFISEELNGSYMYYVHSYYAEISRNTIAQTEYITPFSAALKKDNFYATQFHPEKSGKAGEVILKEFMKL